MEMARIKLGENARQEIRESIGRCRTSHEVAAEVERLSSHFGVRKQRIYEITKDLRGGRKTRADKGKRVIDFEDERLQLVAGWIDTYKVKVSDAVLMARQRGIDIPVEFPTVSRLMREAGLDKKNRVRPQTAHRRFEASAPGEMFQFDISGLKERWFDTTNRRLISVSSLEVSKNHENTKKTRVRVWRFSIIDDFSRRIFIRYVAVDKPNSSHVVDFLLQAYAEMGVPHKLYTDNDEIIKFGRNARATEILNKILADQGGYENVFHLPGNSRATGKVERLHQSVEQEEKLLGLYLAERGDLTIDALNEQFAQAVCNRKNNTPHRETLQTPLARWESAFSIVRRLNYADLRSAFMADEFEFKLRGDLTFRLKGQAFQLPTTDRYPFASWIGQKLRVVFPDNQDFFTLIGLDGSEYDIAKAAPVADTAGEWRSTAVSKTENLRKKIREVAKADAKRIRQIGEAAPIPYFEEDFAPAAETGNLAKFPKPETEITIADVAEAAPGRVTDSFSDMLNFWDAVNEYTSRFASKKACKEFMDTVFSSRDAECWRLRSEVEEALASVQTKTSGGKLRLLKTA
mgnify:CR=1 FL=1